MIIIIKTVKISVSGKSGLWCEKNYRKCEDRFPISENFLHPLPIYIYIYKTIRFLRFIKQYEKVGHAFIFFFSYSFTYLH